MVTVGREAIVKVEVEPVMMLELETIDAKELQQLRVGISPWASCGVEMGDGVGGCKARENSL